MLIVKLSMADIGFCRKLLFGGKIMRSPRTWVVMGVILIVLLAGLAIAGEILGDGAGAQTQFIMVSGGFLSPC